LLESLDVLLMVLLKQLNSSLDVLRQQIYGSAEETKVRGMDGRRTGGEEFEMGSGVC
jgi:hypothetical protein